MGKNRVNSIDGLKGIGCCIVAFCWHYQHFSGYTTPPLHVIFWPFYKWGCAVELFFMLSGYVMSLAYDIKIHNGKCDFKSYIYRRYRRLWPISITTFLVVSIGLIMYRRQTGELFVVEHFDPYHFILNVLLLQSGWFENSYSFNSPAWFVSTIILMYCVYYGVCKIEKKIYKDREIIFGVAYIPAIVGLGAIIGKVEVPFLHYMFAARGLCCFFIGVLMQRLIEAQKNREAGAVVMTGVIACATLFILRNQLNLVQITCILVVFPVMILLMTNVKWIQHVLFIKPVQWIGRYSMEIFMWHFPIQLFLSLLNNHFGIMPYEQVWFFFVYIVLTFGIAVAYKKFASYVSNIIRLGGASV